MSATQDLLPLARQFFQKCVPFDGEAHGIDGIEYYPDKDTLYWGGDLLSTGSHMPILEATLGDALAIPFIRNALVGAVREWLSKNCCYLDIRERRSPDRWGDCRLKITVSWEIPSGATAAEDFEHDPDTGADPDPLRALLLAALAVADQKEQAK